MPHDDIPDLLGRVLSGTKYGVKQTRGKFGLGAKMALIWSKMSTGLPIEIWSAMREQSFVSHYKLDIDIHRYLKQESISCCFSPQKQAEKLALTSLRKTSFCHSFASAVSYQKSH